MSSETALSQWLRAEMPRRGYPVGGPRAGGITRLAEHAGIPQASMSRLVNSGGEASIDNLRKIGKVLGYPLGEMMVFAGLAEPDEMVNRLGSAALSAASSLKAAPEVIPAQPDDFPGTAQEWAGLSHLERYLWLAPGASVHIREAWISMLRSITRINSGGARPGDSGEYRRSV